MSNDLKNNSGRKTINIFLDIDYNIYKNRIKKYIFADWTVILEDKDLVLCLI